MKFIAKRQKYEQRTISIGKKKFTAIVADSPTKRMIGLMFRKELGRQECMLFIFPRGGFYGIWMYNMLFPIDIVWVNSAMSFVDAAENVKPCKSFIGCKEYTPRGPARYVIEFSAGAVKANKINNKSKFVLQQNV